MTTAANFGPRQPEGQRALKVNKVIPRANYRSIWAAKHRHAITNDSLQSPLQVRQTKGYGLVDGGHVVIIGYYKPSGTSKSISQDQVDERPVKLMIAIDKAEVKHPTRVCKFQKNSIRPRLVELNQAVNSSHTYGSKTSIPPVRRLVGVNGYMQRSRVSFYTWA
jgi:hypothetical protein